MQKLYLDCDGVILDTVSTEIYNELKKQGIEGEKKVRKYFSKLDWDAFIEERGEIKEATKKIKELCKYFDVEILTHVNSENEGNSKTKYFAEKIPNVKVITVPKAIDKADFVEAQGNILVDDYLPNLDYWSKQGGISVKYSDSGKQCEYYTITDLLDLLEIDFAKKNSKRILEKE